MSTKSNSNIQKKMKRLEEIVDWFESDTTDIDEALKKFEEGQKLAAELQEEVKAAKNKFTKLQKKFNDS